MLFKLRDMQDWDAIKNGRFRSINKSFDFLEAVNEISDIVKPQCKFKAIALEFIESSLPQHVIGDKLRLQQVLLNLV
jgi:signal transduction histidine kinase